MATATAQTASDVIRDALLAINVIRVNQSPSANQSALAIRKLNQMMAFWESNGKLLGFIPVGEATDTLTVPDGAILGIVNNLAIHLAPSFGAQVPDDVRGLATAGLLAIEKMGARSVVLESDLPTPADVVGGFNVETD